jgi:hypothetical protein
MAEGPDHAVRAFLVLWEQAPLCSASERMDCSVSERALAASIAC